MKRIYQISLLTLLLAAVFASGSFALVEWNIHEIVKTDAPPVDFAVSRNGKWIFVLTAPGDILIYTPDGRLQDTIGVGKHIDQIEMGPKEDLLLLKSRQKQTVEVLVLDFIRNISTSGSPFKGPADAPVVISVFSDFEWPYCARLVPLLERVLEKNPETVKLVFKNFPLGSHPYAAKAARAAMAADAKGKFWQFHDRLFINYNRLNDRKIGDIARQLGFDPIELAEQMKSPQVRSRIERDILDGKQAGVKSTPAVFINGKRLRSRTLKGFQNLVDKELQK